METKNLGILATIATYVGGITALIFGILNLQAGFILNIIYGVLLLLVTAGSIVMAILYNTKLKTKQDRFGFYFSVLPIWLIEALSLLTINYAYLSDPSLMITFILVICIVATGSVGFGLIVRGKIIAGRILSLIFLGITLIGTVLNLASSGTYYLSVLGNILRLGAIALATTVLFMTKRLSPLSPSPKANNMPKEKSKPVVEEKAPVVNEEAVSVPKVESNQTMRDKLLEAKQLYEDGLISEEEYTALKKKVIDRQ